MRKALKSRPPAFILDAASKADYTVFISCLRENRDEQDRTRFLLRSFGNLCCFV